MAGRIPQSFVDNLLDRVDIVELIDGRVKLKKSGKNYMACCPFHDEKTPSFSVNAEKQFYHCFGCGASGNALGFLMEYEHQGFPEAVETLARQQGMEVPRDTSVDPAEEKKRQDSYSILEKAAGFYREQLRSHPQAQIAQDYLKNRGLTGHIARDFGIGYAPEGWDNLIKYFASTETAVDKNSVELLLRAGMLVEKDNDKTRIYDRFRHRIMFPIRDVRGRVIAFGGRVLNDDKPKYLNSPETEVFHKGRELYGLYEAVQANRHLERIVVVEGYMDVVALAQYGISFATATLGTAASEAHLEKAFRYAPEVVFCFDGDEAGTRAARRALEVCLPTLGDGRQVRFLFLPQGEDPDTLVRKTGTEDFLKRLQNAMPLSEFLFEVAAEGLSLSTPEGRAQLITNVLPSLKRIPDGAYKLQLKNLLATKGQTDASSVNTLLESLSVDAVSFDAIQTVRKTEERTKKPSVKVLSMRKHGLADEALSLLLQQPSLLDFCEGVDQLQELDSEEDIKRFLRLVALLRELPSGVSLNKIMGRWGSLHGSGDSVHLHGLAARESLLDEQGRIQQFQDTLGRLQGQIREQRMQTLINKQKAQGLSGSEKEQLNALLMGRI